MAEVLGAVSIISTVLSLSLDTVRTIDIIGTSKGHTLATVRTKLVKISQELLLLQRYSLTVPFQERIIMTTHLDSVMTALSKTIERLNRSLTLQARDDSQRRTWTKVRWVLHDWQRTVEVLERHEGVLRMWITSASMTSLSIKHSSVLSDGDLTRISDKTPQGFTEDQRLRILQWLSPVDHRERHLAIQQQRLDSTGRWLLDSSEFRNWRNSASSSLLWLYGRAGTGKTFLASTIIDHISAGASQDNYAVLYFYCDFRQPRLFVDVAASLTRQIVSMNAQLPSLVRDLFGRSDPEELPSLADLIRIYVDAASNFTEIFVVLDAFDELQMDGRDTFIGLIHNFQHPVTRVLVLSRLQPPEDLQEAFPQITALPLSPNEDDLHAVLSERLSATPFINMDDNLRTDLVVSLTQRANGLFFSPVLQIHDIVKGAYTRKDIREALRMLPPTLDGVVSNRLNMINEQAPRLRHIAANTLMWLSHSKRPLLVQELCEVLALQSSVVYLDQDDFPTPPTVLESCMGLVTIDSSSTASLSHSSIVLNLRNMQNKLFSFGVVRTCWKCLQYIELPNFADCYPTSEQETDILTQHPFLDYASANWMYHVQDVINEEFALLQILRNQPRKSVGPESLKELLEHIWTATDRLILRGSTASSTSSWPLVFQFNTFPKSVHKDGAKHGMTMPRRLTSGLSILHICARFSFVREARRFLESQSLYDAPRYYKTSDDVPMEGLASPVNVLSGVWTPMHEAARCNSLLIAQMLVKNGYRADNLDDQRTPLHYASYNGHSDMVSTLLPLTSLDITEHTSRKTALHFAAKMGHLEVVQILLAAGASSDVRDIHDRTALHYAAENGHRYVAQKLLEHGADPKAVSQNGQTALHCAVIGRSEDLVRDLLMQDASVISMSDSFDRTPLHLSAERAFLIVVEMLLAEGADVDEVDSFGKTPLMYAILSGRSEVVKALLQRFADPNRASSINAGSLKVGSPKVYLHVEPVMDSSNDAPEFSAPEFSGETALFVAVRRNEIELVRLLLQAGAIVDWTNSRGETALFIAATNGMVDIAKLLVEAGADVNIRTRSNLTPIEAAVKHRKVEMFQLLLDLGAAYDTNLSSDVLSDGSPNTEFMQNRDKIHEALATASTGSGFQGSSLSFRDYKAIFLTPTKHKGIF